MRVRCVGVIIRVLGVFLLACSMVRGQQPCDTNVLVTALNPKTNQPIDGLTAGDFHAKFGGREISIVAAAPAPPQRRIVFVLDRSRSMTDASNDSLIGRFDPNSLGKLTLEDAISAIPSRDSVAFLAFAGKYSDETGFMRPDAALKKMPELLKWKPVGPGPKVRTALWDNLDSAFRMLTPHEPGDVIVVLSDGGDNMSALSESKVRDKLESAGVEVLAMLIVEPDVALSHEVDGLYSLLDLAEETGGAARVTGLATNGSDPKVIVPVLPDRLMRLLAHQYELEVEFPCAGKPEKWRLETGPLESGKRALLFYPRALYPRTATP